MGYSGDFYNSRVYSWVDIGSYDRARRGDQEGGGDRTGKGFLPRIEKLLGVLRGKVFLLRRRPSQRLQGEPLRRLKPRKEIMILEIPIVTFKLEKALTSLQGSS
jgi:hypothetical protein